MRPEIVIIVLIFFVLSLGSFLYFALEFAEQSAVSTPQSDSAEVYLTLDSGVAPGVAAKRQPEKIPTWMLILIPGFALLQSIPVIIASHRAHYRHLNPRTVNEITFLCETPMYLGLLGSLLGVCLTQFTTGSVAAPLAYLTTISGILVYLFARYSVAIPAIDAVQPHVWREV